MPREHSRWVAVAQTFCAGRSPSLRPRSGFLQGPRDGFDDGEEDAAADAAADDLPHDRAEIKTAGGGPGLLGHSDTAHPRRDDISAHASDDDAGNGVNHPTQNGKTYGGEGGGTNEE